MSHLKDLEELILTVKNNETKNYLEEAMSCYMVGAYRACIVLTYIALFDDIVKKLGELGNVNNKAKKIHRDAQNKINNQDVYETYVIEQLTANQLLPVLDTEFLEILRRIRNKAAHPSGHHPSAEEARYIFSESINRFLSKPILTTTQIVDEILARLDGQYFFPEKKCNKVASIVKKELTNIHIETYPYLITKLLEKTQSSNSILAENASFFLTGLSDINDPSSLIHLRKYIISQKCYDSKYSPLILRLIAANGKLVNELDPSTFDRLVKILSDRILEVESTIDSLINTSSARILISIIKNIKEDLFIEKLGLILDEFFKKNILNKYFLQNIDISNQSIIDRYFNVICNELSSGNFDTANYISRNIQDIDQQLSNLLSEEQSYILLIHIMKAADSNAWGAQDLMKKKFINLPNIKALAWVYVDNKDNQQNVDSKFVESIFVENTL